MKTGFWLLASLAALSLATPPAWAWSGATGEQRAASSSEKPRYGPLVFNAAKGGDFYIIQNGKFATAKLVKGAIEFHLKGAPFEIGYNGEQANICLATREFDEVRADPTGYKASCLSGAMTGARYPNSDELLVYSGKEWTDGNTELSDATTMKAKPLSGYRVAYQINKLSFTESADMKLETFAGTLFGYIVVYRQSLRVNKDIMPIRIIID